MSRYRLSRLARADLGDIRKKIAEDDEKAADRVIDKIVHRLPDLAHFPESGRTRAELAPGLRSVAVKPYVIFDRIVEGGVEIVRAVHGARDLRALFGE